MVIDLWTPVMEYVQDQRQRDPHFALSTDGVHMNDEGHRVLARTVLAAWGHKKPLPTDRRLLELTHKRSTLLHDAWLSHVGHKRPGVKAGLPLATATAQAAEIEMQILAHQERP